MVALYRSIHAANCREAAFSALYGIMPLCHAFGPAQDFDDSQANFSSVFSGLVGPDQRALLCTVQGADSCAVRIVGAPLIFIASISHLIAVLLVFLVALALGFRVLELLGFAREVTLESGLFACGLSFCLIEFGVFGLSLLGWLGAISAWFLVILMAAAAGRGWIELRGWTTELAKDVWSHVRRGGVVTSTSIVCLALISLLEALVAMSPLTGSDAMHYHFTVPLLELGRPLFPIFSLTNSFLTGQAHLLISFGLALGDDRVSLGFICLGGFLTAAVLFAIARQLMPFRWSILAALAFLISPLVFWQITTSGSPDIWMGFYIGLAVLAASRGIQANDMRLVVVAGFFAGAAAGVKYTGWIVPFALCTYLLLIRGSRKWAIPCGLASILGGALPLVRNLVWTTDPFFPFLLRWLNLNKVNTYALTSMAHSTRSNGFSLSPLHLLEFPVFLLLKGDNYGLGQYFGPIVLAFAPLLLFAKWKNHTARLAGFVWSLVLFANTLTAQMGRYLLPVYILALALVFSGFAATVEFKWRKVAYGCGVTLVLFLAFGALSDVSYARDFLPVVFGRESRADFLSRMAPDYQYALFVNETLKDRTETERGKVMVFFRHLYYLRLPFVNGEPTSSWVIDPEKCGGADELFRTLQDANVKWIVKTPDYPTPLANAFNQLEVEKRLLPIAASDLQTFTGRSRIYQERQRVKVTILKVIE